MQWKCGYLEGIIPVEIGGNYIFIKQLRKWYEFQTPSFLSITPKTFPVRKPSHLVIWPLNSKFHYAMSPKTVLQFRSQSTSPTSPLSRSTPNCLLSASFRNSLSSYRIRHSHYNLHLKWSNRMSLTAKSSNPLFQHIRSRCYQGFQFQFLGSWSWL